MSRGLELAPKHQMTSHIEGCNPFQVDGDTRISASTHEHTLPRRLAEGHHHQLPPHISMAVCSISLVIRPGSWLSLPHLSTVLEPFLRDAVPGRKRSELSEL